LSESKTLQRIVHDAASRNGTIGHEIMRSKHEHVLHTTPRNVLKSYRNLYHPSWAQKIDALP
jgi:hypothetical protein